MSHRLSEKFVSGGLNPNWDKTCFSCLHLDNGKDRDGGWCNHHANFVKTSGSPVWREGFRPSVSSTGGCQYHEKADN